MAGWDCGEDCCERSELFDPSNPDITFQLLVNFHRNSLVSPNSQASQHLPLIGTTSEKKSYMSIDENPIRTLYVNKIPHRATWNDVLQRFSEFGNIKKLYLKIHTPRPFAFVTFESPDSALAALKNRNVIFILNQKVFINKADSWHQPTENPDGTVNWLRQEKRNTVEENDERDEETEDEEINENIIQGNCHGVKDTIEVLNDDCLQHVFSFLNLIEMIRIERVCKRWRDITYNMWQRVHALEFTKQDKNGVIINPTVVESMLRRCNENLKSLKLSVVNNYLDFRSLFITSKHCRNLEELYIHNMHINNRSLPHLAKYCKKLKKIVFEDCKNFYDNDLQMWFSTSTTLTSITMTNAQGITGTALRVLKSPLQYLNLNNCSNLNLAILTECLKKHSDTMKELSLNGCKAMQRTDIDHIVDMVPNLTSFSLVRPFPLNNAICLKSLGNLTYLTELNLRNNNWVHDQVVSVIVGGCKELTSLNLSGLGTRNEDEFPLTERGLAKIGRLHKLTFLDISYLNQTSDECLKSLTASLPCLKVLRCVGCPTLTDIGCTQVVSLCNELELFDLSGNELVTSDTVKTALDSVKLCTNRKPLQLVVGGTAIAPADFSSVNDARLLINFKNYCKFHLRPDFVDDLFFPPSDEDDDDEDDDDDDDLDELCNEMGYPGMSFEVMMQEYFLDDSDLDDDDDEDEDFDSNPEYDDSMGDSELIFKCF